MIVPADTATSVEDFILGANRVDSKKERRGAGETMKQQLCPMSVKSRVLPGVSVFPVPGASLNVHRSSSSSGDPLPIANLDAMEGRGLTLRSKSRRARPQISAPKPISGPLPPGSKAAGPGTGAGLNGAVPVSVQRERTQQNATTSDLVKRRYSTRFNQAPDLDAPPVPVVPSLPTAQGNGVPSVLTSVSDKEKEPSSDASQRLEVDLSALRDPSLPVERCECFLELYEVVLRLLFCGTSC